MAFLHQIHHNPEFFDDPKTFNPSRFIDESGKFVPDHRVIPFGTGKRFCLGQSLAEKEFFIFFAALMQQFEFKPVPGIELPDYKNIYPQSLMKNVPPYEVVIKKRLA
jgi:cytochrome P450